MAASFVDDNFECIFLIEIALKFVAKGPIRNIPALVQIMAWRRQGDKPLYEPMMFSLLTHIWHIKERWGSNMNVNYNK